MGGLIDGFNNIVRNLATHIGLAPAVLLIALLTFLCCMAVGLLGILISNSVSEWAWYWRYRRRARKGRTW